MNEEDSLDEEFYENSENLENDYENFSEDSDTGDGKSRGSKAVGAVNSISKNGVKGAAINAAKDKAADLVPGSEQAVDAASKVAQASSAVSTLTSIGSTVIGGAKAIVVSFTTPVPYVILIILAVIIQVGTFVFFAFAGYQAFGKNESVCSSASNVSVSADTAGVIAGKTPADEENWLPRANQVADYLTNTPVPALGNKPFTVNQAAAIIGNMAQESGMVQSNYTQSNWIPRTASNAELRAQGGTRGGVAVGLLQMDGDRRIDLIDLADKRGKPWQDATVQMDFLIGEMPGYNGKLLMSGGFGDPNKSVDELTEIFVTKYERAGIPRTEQRIKYAHQFLAQYKGGTYSGGGGGAAGAVNCENFQADAGSVTGSGQFEMPNPGARMTSPFGMRVHPVLGTAKMHNGVDLAKACGSPIKAADAGTVFEATTTSTSGNRVYIDHGNGFKSGYFHLTNYIVKKGDKVTKGQVIGYEGTTGRSTGCHLHFEIKQNDKYVDPMKFIKGAGN